MPRFNTRVTTTTTQTTNLAGGVAYTESPKAELALLVLTSMLHDQFYRKGADALAQLRGLLMAVGPEFAAKTALYARHVHGLRSISHALAVELACVEDWPEKRDFYTNIVRRPDDITEILSYYKQRNPEFKLPKAMQRGLADSFAKFDEYQLAKYRGEGHGLKLVDAVNLLHPHPTPKNGDALKALVADALRSTETWEAKLSAAGDAMEEKEGAWRDLLISGKLPYFALLRNLRNIHQTNAVSLWGAACEQLIDRDAIRKSLVLPFRYLSAYNELAKVSGSQVLLQHIATAAEIALENLPKFAGATLVALDDSGSMGSRINGKGEIDCFTVGAMFAAAFAARGADVLMFSNDARYVNTASQGLFGAMATYQKYRTGHGTNFHSVFERAQQPYDRVIILSDMQGWMTSSSGGGYVRNSRRVYEEKYFDKGWSTRVYSFDLAGYGTLQVPEKETYCLAGFSEKAFDVMAMLEKGEGSLISEIEAVRI